MANRRMFARSITDSDAFTDMPLSSQALYFHLGMSADDDGVVNNPKRIQRCIGASDDDLTVLAAKRFVIPFDSGVIVIKHWKVNNYIRPDRYNATNYTSEIMQLVEDGNGAYALPSSEPVEQLGIPTVDQRYTSGIPDGIPTVDPGKVRLGKDSLGKARLDKDGGKPPERAQFKKPTLDEVAAYIQESGYNIDPQRFIDYYESNGWHVGKSSMKDWRAAIRNWVRNSKESGKGVSPNAEIREYASLL